MKLVGLLLILLGIAVGWGLAYKGMSVSTLVSDLESFLGIPASQSGSSGSSTSGPTAGGSTGSGYGVTPGQLGNAANNVS